MAVAAPAVSMHRAGLAAVLAAVALIVWLICDSRAPGATSTHVVGVVSGMVAALAGGYAFAVIVRNFYRGTRAGRNTERDP